MSKTVIIKIGKAGDVKIDANGFVGASCTDATQPYEAALGMSGGEQELKPEYYEQEGNPEAATW